MQEIVGREKLLKLTEFENVKKMYWDWLQKVDWKQMPLGKISLRKRQNQ